METSKRSTKKTVGNSLVRYAILVLEPHAATRETLVKTLTEAGYAVESFETLTALLTGLDEREVDCIIADTSSPEALGLRLLALLPTSDRPPVVLTAHDTELTDAVHAMRTGASDFLEKPLSRPVLLSRLRRLMHSRGPYGNST